MTVQVLSVMQVVVNTGRGFFITPEDVEQPIAQQVEQPRQMGRCNVRACRERGQPQQPPQPFEEGMPTDPFQSRVDTYLDNLRERVNYHNQAIDVLFTHLNVE